MLENAGKLILRCLLGGLMLFHGVAKLTRGVVSIQLALTTQGWPDWMVYGVYMGELIAPLLLILGFYSRVAGFIIAINMACVFILVHSAQWMDLSKSGGWALELQAFYFFTGLIVCFLGPGRWAINQR